MLLNPEVTIITPCYNAGKYLSTCVESVLAQTFGDWEHLIVDDQSSDGSRAVISRFARDDDRIKLIASSSKLGASKARNLAIERARGKYIAFLDADDWWTEQKLEKQIGHLKATDAKFSCTSYFVVDEDDNLRRVQKVKKLQKKLLLTKRSVVGCLTVLYDREYFKDFFFSENMRSAEDYEMWCRMLAFLEQNGGKAAVLEAPLAYYRTHRGGKSHRKLSRIKTHWNIYRKRLNLSTVYALWCTLNYGFNGIRDRM